ncbi:hypothetical protein [Hymenobacter chitinivorans]|uniref:Uncharacterized protein n=1 Tax=Hymenobacter chitinivorans DSM 11115 TaxID=1121954 RepID=A0A2M9B5M7_9BACT|nr:hypothetical protein [Hymenobacter chitinivorans]PJJ53254.1 hypothetical protein CLV45_3914 [Hymenobacter chitinivorans DSM 11115]
MSTYADQLHAVKARYPFPRWGKNYDRGMLRYSPANCAAMQDAFDTLITDLIALGEHAPEAQKVAAFKTAIEATNVRNQGMIETGEREDLCDLTYHISVAAGLDPSKYGNGEGLASEWREW